MGDFKSGKPKPSWMASQVKSISTKKDPSHSSMTPDDSRGIVDRAIREHPDRGPGLNRAIGEDAEGYVAFGRNYSEQKRQGGTHTGDKNIRRK